MPTLTSNERIRIYVALLDCPHCGAKRGEYCRSSKGRLWFGSIHYIRSMRYTSLRGKEYMKLYSIYENLKAQVFKQRQK